MIDGRELGLEAHRSSEGAKEMRRKLALSLAVATIFLVVPTVGSSFVTPAAARKACQQAGGTWVPYLQICNL
jgi:hypothetical protein